MIARAANPGDQGPIARLLSFPQFSYLAVASAEIPELLAEGAGVVAESDGQVCAALIAELVDDEVAWLRVASAGRERAVQQTMLALIDALNALLRARGVRRLLIANGAFSDLWLRQALQARGFAAADDVLVYETERLVPPARGDATIDVRRATAADLATAIAIDHAAFAPDWYKRGRALEPALGEAPLFVIAERAGRPIGYAFVTAHFGGRLVHLVRIAVLPDERGRGVGVRLLAEVMDYAAAVRANVVTLNTQAANASARRLYEWFGFRLTGERQEVLALTITENSS